MPLHKLLTYVDGHVAHAYEYVSAAARTGATGLVAGDVGKIARQTDDDSFWILTAYSPVTWLEIGGGTGSAENIQIPLVAGETSTNLGAYTRLGAAIFNKASFPATSYTLKIAAQSDNSNEFSVRLYDVTAGAYITGTITSTTANLAILSLTSLTLSTGERLYELHAKLNAGSGADAFLRIPAAFIEVIR